MKQLAKLPGLLLMGAALNWSCLAEPPSSAIIPAAISPERFPFLQRATHLVNLQITDRKNQAVGRIDELILNLGSGQVLGVLAAPPHLYGDYHVFIPAASFSSAGDDRAVLNSDRTNLMAESCISRDVFDSADCSKKIAEAFTHFGAKPVWTEPDGPRGYVKFSQVRGFKLRNPSQENLGQAADLIVDLPGGRIAFLVAALENPGHSFYAAPISALNLDPQDSTFVLDANRAALARAAQSSDFIWAQMTNPNWAAGVYRLYGQNAGVAVQPPPETRAPAATSENLFPKIADEDATTVRIVKPVAYSDAEMTRRVQAAIINQSLGASVADNKVHVSTSQGRVTLLGQSSSADQKAKLRAIAESIAGHENVDDQIEVAAERVH